MELDLGNALAPPAKPGVSMQSLERLDTAVRDAHERIEDERANETHGYQALNQPSQVDVAGIEAAVNSLPKPESILLVGIGGSALGAATVADAIDSDVALYPIDNVDPAALESVLEAVDLEQTVVHVVSRSGETIETIANLVAVQSAMADADVDWTERTLVTTGPEGRLRELAEDHSLPTLEAPPGVPGRYSVLSTVGLPVLALRGHDIEALLSGGQTAVDSLEPSLFETPAYAYGAIASALANRGITVNAMMPYAESLETFAEWFAQLWAESLGKDGLGQLPARALGATDQHSQLQLYRAGPRTTMVTFVRVRTGPDQQLPERAPMVGGQRMREILDTELRATEASLAEAGRPNVRIELDQLDEAGLGELLVGMQAACILAGELLHVDAFEQPAVEWGKRAIRHELAGESSPETEAMAEKHEHWIRR